VNSLPRQRRGFILIFGTRNRVSGGLDRAIEARCPRCGIQSKLVGKQIRPWFTVLFIPIFPVGQSRQFTLCSHCETSFSLAPEELAGHLAKIDARKNQRAIGMYNSLRASPGNSITLNDLMQLYAQMNELDSALSAAADFPTALNSSEQCMTTLGRVYLAKNQYEAALQWLDAAVARNPQFAEAYYYKATAHLRATPCEAQKAAIAARTARNAGYPNAEELLRQAEGKMQSSGK
jgi:tetratricopeptide (TPR) repeat protein